ncbi:MAG: pyridoxamine 5'-phosphate oxidase family protein [Anaerolineae bacterium]|nr:pyridoxamine 5'-phosphate oxidase family protein [Anaerolineae bacterium]
METEEDRIRAEYERLLLGLQSLMLATVDGQGAPLVSYAPFAVDQARQFYIFVSELSGHTANLRRTGQVSVMLIEDEQTAYQIFVRRRLTFFCRASLLERDTPEWQAAAEIYRAKFKEFFEIIQSFQDFQMFKLSPIGGGLVVGFGRAYDISGAALDVLTQRQGV